MTKKNDASSIQEILGRVMKNMGSDGRPSRERLEETWKRLAGEGGFQHSWPKALKGKRLLVEVENSGWMYTLGLRRQEILRGLMELLGAAWVQQLSFRIGERRHA